MDAETAAKQLVEMSYSEWKSLDEQSREMLARAVMAQKTTTPVSYWRGGGRRLWLATRSEPAHERR